MDRKICFVINYSIKYYYIGGGALIGGFEKGIAMNKKDNKKKRKQGFKNKNKSKIKMMKII